jgi:hypothetical protein
MNLGDIILAGYVLILCGGFIVYCAIQATK